MKYNPSKHHRHSIRLRGYDYSSSGAYFITANVQDRLCLFGAVHENGVQLNDTGNIALRCWEDIPIHFPHAELDEFIIMPNHMHGIIFILPNDDNYRGGADHNNRRGVQLWSERPYAEHPYRKRHHKKGQLLFKHFPPKEIIIGNCQNI